MERFHKDVCIIYLEEFHEQAHSADSCPRDLWIILKVEDLWKVGAGFQVLSTRRRVISGVGGEGA